MSKLYELLCHKQLLISHHISQISHLCLQGEKGPPGPPGPPVSFE